MARVAPEEPVPTGLPQATHRAPLGKDTKLNISDLTSALEYRDGALYWKTRTGAGRGVSRFNSVFSGKRVKGELDRLGYLRIEVLGVRLKYHRVVFALHHGYFPDTVDHINRVRCDNRIENLRDATRSQQQLNRWHPVGVSGYTGVHAKGARWVARIKRNGRSLYVGTFKTVHEAKAARDSALSALTL